MSVIVSRGRTVAVRAQASPPWPAGTDRHRGPSAGVVPLLGREARAATYEAMYRSQPWVFAAVNKLTYAITQLPIKVYDEDANGTKQRVRGHPLARLMRRPWYRRSSAHLKLFVGGELMIHARCLLVKARPSAGVPPGSLWPVPWRHVEVIENDHGIAGFLLHLNGKRIPIDPTDAVYLELLGGVSPLEPLRRTLALEDAAMNAQGQTWQRGVTIRGAFVKEDAFSRAQKSDLPRLKAELEKVVSGYDNAGSFALLDHGLKWVPVSMNMVEAELVAQRKLSREEVAAAYDVSPPLLGILDRATFNNVERLWRSLYTDSLGPKLVIVEEGLEVQLIDDEPSWDGLGLEFDLNAVLRPEPAERFRAYLMAQQSSTNTVNERRRMENLPPIGDPDDPANPANTVLLPANMIPLGAEVTEAELELRAQLSKLAPVADALLAEAVAGDRDGTIADDDTDEGD